MRPWPLGERPPVRPLPKQQKDAMSPVSDIQYSPRTTNYGRPHSVTFVLTASFAGSRRVCYPHSVSRYSDVPVPGLDILALLDVTLHHARLLLVPDPGCCKAGVSDGLLA